MTIYADEIFAVNALSDLLLLCTCCVLNSGGIRWRRVIAASVLGGGYAVAEAVFYLPHVLRTAVLFCMMLMVSGRKRVVTDFLKCVFMLVFVEGAVTAGMSILGADAVLVKGTVNIFAPAAAVTVVYLLAYPALLLIRYVSRRKKRFYEMVIEHNGRRADFRILRDSGNLLRFHNKPVAVVSWDGVAELFGNDDFEAYRQKAENFVMYGTIGGGGAAPVFEPDRCTLDGIPREVEIAVTDRKFGTGWCGVAGEI